MVGQSTSGVGVYGKGAVAGNFDGKVTVNAAADLQTAAVQVANAANGYGAKVTSTLGAGVFGSGNTIGVIGNGCNVGIQGAGNVFGVQGNGNMIGVQGADAVSAIPAPGNGGVWGDSANSYGVIGTSNLKVGVFGYCDAAQDGGPAPYRLTYIGVQGRVNTSRNGIGSLGLLTHVGVAGDGGEKGWGLYATGGNYPGKPPTEAGTNGAAAWFDGDVHVNGNLSKPGGGFRIDHPLVPTEKFLNHSFVESPERKNVYDGIAVLDGDGGAVVELPHWFEAVNESFRYQLTAIGGIAPNLHIAEKIIQGRFKIAGGAPALEVSWQVTGNRCDPWAKANPLSVEQDKRPLFTGSGRGAEPVSNPDRRAFAHAQHGWIVSQVD